MVESLTHMEKTILFLSFTSYNLLYRQTVIKVVKIIVTLDLLKKKKIHSIKTSSNNGKFFLFDPLSLSLYKLIVDHHMLTNIDHH